MIAVAVAVVGAADRCGFDVSVAPGCAGGRVAGGGAAVVAVAGKTAAEAAAWTHQLGDPDIAADGH